MGAEEAKEKLEKDEGPDGVRAFSFQFVHHVVFTFLASVKIEKLLSRRVLSSRVVLVRLVSSPTQRTPRKGQPNWFIFKSGPF